MFTRTRAPASSNYLGHTLKYYSCYRAPARFIAPGIYCRADENTHFDRPRSPLCASVYTHFHTVLDSFICISLRNSKVASHTRLHNSCFRRNRPELCYKSSLFQQKSMHFCERFFETRTAPFISSPYCYLYFVFEYF